MPDFLVDTFAGSSGSNLTARTPETGGTWIKSTGWAGDVLLTGSGGITSSGTSVYENTATPGSADYQVSITLTPTGGAIAGQLGVIGRKVAGVNTFYFADYSGSGWRLFVNNSGSASQIGSFSQSLTTGTSYTLVLRMVGTTISVLIDGVSRISVTDSVATAAGRAGVVLIGSGATGVLSSMTAGDIPSAPPTLVSGTASVSATGLTTATVACGAASGGTSPYTYQWQRSTTSGSGFSNVSGATSLTLNDTGLTRGTTYYYRCVTTDSASVSVSSAEVSLTTKTSQLVADGNSQTVGSSATSWATLISPMIPSNWAISNIAVSAQTTAAMVSDATSQVVPLLASANTANLVVVQEVMNHIYFNATAQQAYDSLVQYCGLVRGVNGSKVIVICPQPTRGDFPGGSTLPGATGADKRAEYASRVAAFMVLFRAGWRTFCDGFLDPGYDPRLADYTNLTYYSGDGVHWTTAAETVIAGGVAALFPSALANTADAGSGSTTVFRVIGGSLIIQGA